MLVSRVDTLDEGMLTASQSHINSSSCTTALLWLYIFGTVMSSRLHMVHEAMPDVHILILDRC